MLELRVGIRCWILGPNWIPSLLPDGYMLYASTPISHAFRVNWGDDSYSSAWRRNCGEKERRGKRVAIALNERKLNEEPCSCMKPTHYYVQDKEKTNTVQYPVLSKIAHCSHSESQERL